MTAKILLTPFANTKTVLNMQIATGKIAVVQGNHITLTSKPLTPNQRAQKNAALEKLYKPTPNNNQPPTPPTGGFAA